MSDELELVACASCSSDYRPDELATTPNGDVLCSDCRIYCDRCEEYRWEDGSRHVEGIGAYCESCADNYTFWCESCESTYSDNEGSYHVEDIGVKGVALTTPTGARVVRYIIEIVVSVVIIVVDKFTHILTSLCLCSMDRIRITYTSV